MVILLMKMTYATSNTGARNEQEDCCNALMNN